MKNRMKISSEQLGWKVCSTSPPGGNQVDGLPPGFYIITRRAEILPASRVILTHSSNNRALPPRRSMMLDVDISIYKYFAFELLVPFYSKSANHIELSFPLSISLGANSNLSFEPGCVFLKKLI